MNRLRLFRYLFVLGGLFITCLLVKAFLLSEYFKVVPFLILILCAYFNYFYYKCSEDFIDGKEELSCLSKKEIVLWTLISIILLLLQARSITLAYLSFDMKSFVYQFIGFINSGMLLGTMLLFHSLRKEIEEEQKEEVYE